MQLPQALLLTLCVCQCICHCFISFNALRRRDAMAPVWKSERYSLPDFVNFGCLFPLCLGDIAVVAMAVDTVATVGSMQLLQALLSYER